MREIESVINLIDDIVSWIPTYNDNEQRRSSRMRLKEQARRRYRK